MKKIIHHNNPKKVSINPLQIVHKQQAGMQITALNLISTVSIAFPATCPLRDLDRWYIYKDCWSPANVASKDLPSVMFFFSG